MQQGKPTQKENNLIMNVQNLQRLKVDAPAAEAELTSYAAELTSHAVAEKADLTSYAVAEAEAEAELTSYAV